jgi:hypothetical protein
MASWPCERRLEFARITKGKSKLKDRKMANPVLLAQDKDDWLDEVVTDQAKQDPDWRVKARSGRGSIEVDSKQQSTDFEE